MMNSPTVHSSPRFRIAQPAPSRRGFTLIELIATIVVLSVLGTVSAGIIFTATDGYLSASTTATLHNEASLAMDRITRELREIARDGSAAVPHINEISADAIRWEEDSELFVEGQSLMFRDRGETPVALANRVAVFAVQSFDEENDALPASMNGDACHDIRRIELTLTLSRHGESEVVRTRVFVRAAMRDGGDGP